MSWLEIFAGMYRWILLFTLWGIHAFGQQRVEGTIIDKQTKEPIPYASIGILGTHKGTSSNIDGQFSLLIDGPCQIKISSVGYESYTFHSSDHQPTIALTPRATELINLYIYNKPINPTKIVRKAFASVYDNYSTESFTQRYFYRHYCMDDSVYGRLIEASVEVWKQHGYKPLRHAAGEREAIRVTQLRRSLDKTIMAQGHQPISVENILQADIMAYQTAEQSKHLKFYEDASSLKTDFKNYIFTFEGITSYDGQEVYKIHYTYRPDSILTEAGFRDAPQATGTLFITTDKFAIIKTEDIRQHGLNSIRTQILYSKDDGRYYPYHFVREGGAKFSAKSGHSFRIEMIAVETRSHAEAGFTSQLPTKENLLQIPYDSTFWRMATTLKTTPLEDKIIQDLGGGHSLDKQFERYQQYEWSTTNGGENADEKLNWFLQDSRNERILYIGLWDSNLRNYFFELERLKQLNKKYRGRITFILLSVESNDIVWNELISKYNLFAEGILNYRIGISSDLARLFPVKKTPVFYAVTRAGKVHEARSPSDPLIEKYFNDVMDQHQRQ